MAAAHAHDGNTGGGLNPLDSFRRVAETQRQVAEVSRQALEQVKLTYKRPEDLAAGIESKGTPVYVLHFSFWVLLALKVLGYEPGFIPPTNSPRYARLTRFLQWVQPQHNGDIRYGVFVVPRSLFSVGFLAHQLHHWIAYTSGLPGYGETDQALYRTFWERHRGVVGPEVETMTTDEIIRLKNAINRDMEALKFMQQLMQEIFVPAKQAGNLTNGTTSA